MNACGGRLTIVSNQRHCRRTLGRTQTGQGLDMLNKGRALNFGQGRQGVGQMGDWGGRWCRVSAGFCAAWFRMCDVSRYFVAAFYSPRGIYLPL